MFKNLVLVWEITLHDHRSCELLPRGGSVCRESTICRWILENRMCVCVCWSLGSMCSEQFSLKHKSNDYKTGALTFQGHEPNMERRRARGGLRASQGISLRWERKDREVGKVPEQVGKKRGCDNVVHFRIDPKAFPPRLLQE